MSVIPEKEKALQAKMTRLGIYEKDIIEKIRRQKRKRSKRAKEKMLAKKRKTSQKKELRASVRECDE